MGTLDIFRKKPLQLEATTGQWEKYIQLAHQYPIGDVNAVRQLLTNLNTRQFQTELEFHMLPVVDGAVSPDVQYDIPHIRVTTTGPVIRAVLEKLPRTVRKGTDQRHIFWQIRLDDWNSWDHQMGETTLLSVFLNCHDEKEACFLLPDDPNSHTNWGVILNMHDEHFPKKD